MRRLATPFILIAILAVPSGAQEGAREGAPGACASPEAVEVTGNSRVDTSAVRSSSGLTIGATLSVTDVQRAIKSLYGTGQYDDVQIVCRVSPATGRASLVIQVKERPVLTAYQVIGADKVSPKDVRERLAFPTGAPLDPAKIAAAIER